MKEEIESLRRALPEMKTIAQSEFFSDAIDNLIDSLNDQIEMVENSLIVLKNDLAFYAIKYSLNFDLDNQ